MGVNFEAQNISHCPLCPVKLSTEFCMSMNPIFKRVFSMVMMIIKMLLRPM